MTKHHGALVRIVLKYIRGAFGHGEGRSGCMFQLHVSAAAAVILKSFKTKRAHRGGVSVFQLTAPSHRGSASSCK